VDASFEPLEVSLMATAIAFDPVVAELIDNWFPSRPCRSEVGRQIFTAVQESVFILAITGKPVTSIARDARYALQAPAEAERGVPESPGVGESQSWTKSVAPRG
jgi:hypothetical protein